jgi:Family of unknown function (DUF6326)
MGSAVLMEIPIAMILAYRLLPFRANRLANIIAGCRFDPGKRFPDLRCASARMGQAAYFPEYSFFATIETVDTSVIIWQAWTWSGTEGAVTSNPIARQSATGITSS